VTCDEVRDLLPGYALALLDDEETRSVDAHLEECAEHEDDLLELRATTLALDLLREDTVEEQPISATLRARVRALSGAASPTPLWAASTPRRRPWWLVAAAVVALLAVFASGWATRAVLSDDDATPAALEVRYAYALQGANGEFVSFTGVEGSDKVTVKMAGLARLPGDQRYRLWAIRDGRWERIGQCNTNAQGGWLGDFAFALAAGEQLAVTIEETTADPQPPAAPILTTRS
jgi:hypothetical protein